MGLLGMMLSATATAVGALMYWAVTNKFSYFRFTTTGVILLMVGALGFVVSVILYTDSKSHAQELRSSSRSRRTVDVEGAVAMLSRSRSRELAASTTGASSTVSVDATYVVEAGGSLLARARERLGVAVMSGSGEQPRIAARSTISEPSEHCFFVDGAWKCVGDRCRIQQHRQD